MAKITNLTRDTMSFITGVRDGAAVTESLKAGETRDIAVDLADAQLQGRILAGSVGIEGPALAPAKSAARQPAAERRTASTLGGDATVRE
ncbi:hypothetical protein FNL55_12685 [Tardiphaga sp. vice352]|uniref:hypothetical protein n=1 Tax=Tardiphaga sp. vice352 TaxID=2592816 RepID=UPI001162C807|nr:hypothetical protein [Tardiphaga sp. vice352]QDM32095.1 hypothetical protein FNL55_12685 [Tardiphaga sp. vice352]